MSGSPCSLSVFSVEFNYGSPSERRRENKFIKFQNTHIFIESNLIIYHLIQINEQSLKVVIANCNFPFT